MLNFWRWWAFCQRLVDSEAFSHFQTFLDKKLFLTVHVCVVVSLTTNPLVTKNSFWKGQACIWKKSDVSRFHVGSVHFISETWVFSQMQIMKFVEPTGAEQSRPWGPICKVKARVSYKSVRKKEREREREREREGSLRSREEKRELLREWCKIDWGGRRSAFQALPAGLETWHTLVLTAVSARKKMQRQDWYVHCRGPIKNFAEKEREKKRKKRGRQLLKEDWDERKKRKQNSWKATPRKKFASGIESKTFSNIFWRACCHSGLSYLFQILSHGRDVLKKIS